MSDLALLRFNYLGFDGEVKRGPMVVNASVARDVLGVFRALFDAGFPIKHVALSRPFDPEDRRDTTRSITSSFNCRPVRAEPVRRRRRFHPPTAAEGSSTAL
jgi:hypothetical protein